MTPVSTTLFITDAGVRVFYYLANQEARLDSAMDKIMASLTLFGAELEREKARQRAYDSAEQKARQGFVTGGEPYGYENVHFKSGVEVPRGTPHDYVKRRIKEDEAATIRNVFKIYAAGYGFTVIAKTMNGHPRYADALREFFDGTLPAPPRHGARTWAPAAIREWLYRPLYRGEIHWGRRTRVDRNGRAGIRVKRDPSELLVVPAEDLRIIPKPLWQVVQERLQAVNQSYLRNTQGKLAGKLDLRNEGRYLLSGLAQCGVCGWNLVVRGNTPRIYGCSHFHQRGTCTNALSQHVPKVDDSFLAALEREVLTPERFRYAVEVAVEQVRERLAEDPDSRPALEREKASLARKIERMVAAIGDGRGPVALVREIAKAEARIQEIETEVARLETAPNLTVLDLKRLEREVEAELARFADLLRGNVPRARQALKKLLVDRVTFTPIRTKNGRQTYAFTGELSYGALLRGVTEYLDGDPLGTPRKYIGSFQHLELTIPFSGKVAA